MASNLLGESERGGGKALKDEAGKAEGVGRRENALKAGIFDMESRNSPASELMHYGGVGRSNSPSDGGGEGGESDMEKNQVFSGKGGTRLYLSCGLQGSAART